MEALKKLAQNAKSIMILIIVLTVFYNMFVIPVAAGFGLVLPIILIDEATKFLMTVSTLGVM